MFGEEPFKAKICYVKTLDVAEDTLWTGIPGNYTNPNAPKALAEVRKLVDNGEYVEATKEAVKLSGDPSDVCKRITFNTVLNCP